jgi:GT2 family glycosyltransferase
MYPLTSIIILTKNNIQFTERCLRSIFEQINPQHTPYEIIIADENSTDGTREMCEMYRDQVKYLNLPEYNSFSSRNNAAVKEAKGEFLWFLNNDTELINNTLHFMLRHFANPKIGVVGNMHLFPNGTLNHMGIAISDNLHPEHIFPHEDPSLPYINHGRFIDLMSAASIVYRRSAYEQVGGFDEAYGWGYEDVDLCLKVKEAGYLAYCDSEGRIIHFGQSTYGRTDHDQKNYEIFLGKWKEKLVPNLEEIYKEKYNYVRSQQRFTKIPKKIARTVTRTSAKVVTATVKRARTEEEVPKSKIYVYKSPRFSAFTDIAEQLEKEIKEPHTVIDDIHDLYKVDNPPKSGAILVTTTHFGEEYLIPSPEWVRDYRTYDINYERTTYDNPDYWTKALIDSKFTILASSEYCRDFLIKSGANKDKVVVLPHGYNNSLTEFDFTHEVNPDKVVILVVINTNDEVRYGTEYLAEAFTYLQEHHPEVIGKIKLVIKNYGGKTTEPYFKTKEYLDFLASGVEIEYVSKFLTKEDLAKLYYKCDLFIAPYRGEGFGMKILDAAVAGLPVICPDYGGPRDYLKHAVHIPVKHELVTVGWGLDYYGLFLDDTYKWAQVDSVDLAKQIKYGIENIVGLKNRAIGKRDHLRKEFSYKTIWENLKKIDENRLAAFKHYQNQKFEFFDAEITQDISTSTRKQNTDIKTTLLINTNRPQDLVGLFEHLDKNFDVNKELEGEILIIDDASGENGQEILSKFDHLPIRYIQYAKWGGSGFARDVGLHYASGDNIIIIGDDIKPLPGFFKRHRMHYENHPEPYLLMGHVEWDKEIRNIPIAEFATKITSFQFGFEEIRNQTEISYWHVYTSNLSFRKSDIEKAKQHFKVGMILYEDTIWAKELQDRGFRIYYSRQACALHNHKVKNGWLEWLKSRSETVGKYNVRVYAQNPIVDQLVSKTNILIEGLSAEYAKNSKAELKKFAKAYDLTAENLDQSYLNLEKLDHAHGYNAELRSSIYELCSSINLLHRFRGIALEVTHDEEIAKGLAFLEYNQFMMSQRRPSFQPSGFKESFRQFIFMGRQRFPIVFENIFKLGKSIKSVIK